MSPARITGTIRPESPRYREWVEIFGGDTVVLESAMPVVGHGPHGTALFYRLSVGSLTVEARARLIKHVALKFSRTYEEVVRDLDNPLHGCPILAKDVWIIGDPRSKTNVRSFT